MPSADEPYRQKGARALDALRANPKNRRYRDIVSVLSACGWAIDRGKGSHEVWKKGTSILTVLKLHGPGDKTYYESTVKGYIRKIEEAESQNEPEER